MSIPYGDPAAGELASTGVRINCVCPGVIDTGMMERWTCWTDLMPDKEEAKEMLGDDADRQNGHSG